MHGEQEFGCGAVDMVGCSAFSTGMDDEWPKRASNLFGGLWTRVCL